MDRPPMYQDFPKLSGGRGRAMENDESAGSGDREMSAVGGLANLAIAVGGGGSGNDSAGGGSGDLAYRSMVLPALRTRPEGLSDKTGKGGTVVKCLTNYIAIRARPDFKIYQYHVSYEPVIDSKSIRQKLIRDRRDLFGDNPVFDGMILYQGDKFNDDPMVFENSHPVTGRPVTITVKLTKVLPPDDPQCLTLLNLCNRRVFELAGYVQLGRNFYDRSHPRILKDFKLEVWPGMISAIRCHENQLLMVSEVSHKVLRQDTVHSFMMGIYKKDSEHYQENVMQELVGSIVLTRYNNKTYRVDEISWNVTPKVTFDLENGRTVSFIEYYRENYNITIRDPDQPMLLSRGKRKAGLSDSDPPNIYLVPELCSMTGLTDEMRANRRLMQDLAMQTRVQPAARIQYVRDYLKKINEHMEATKLFSRWGIELDSDVLRIEGRELTNELLYFGQNASKNYDRTSSSWSRECGMNKLDDPRNLSKWIIVFSPNTRGAAETFFRHAKALGSKWGMGVSEPIAAAETEDDSIRSFLAPIRKYMQEEPDLQIVVAVVPNDNKARYDAIKKYCYLENGMPNQIIKARSLDKNTLSVCANILMQINCKLGGSLWHTNIPLKNAMLIGYDLYNDSSSRDKKVGAAVFSLDANFTKWYSQCAFHGENKELVANLVDFCSNGLKRYKEVNGRLPERIILFRDGVGDGHIPVVYKEELPQVQKAFLNVGGDDYQPRFAFVIVTKRVHSRYFKECGNGTIVNPIPGTVVDDVITRSERYDFYLVPQAVRQGTVTPVSYNVIFDESGLSPTNMQKLAYKLCHMYYNWQGTIRVPAPCQFAHKLATLVGQTLHQAPNDGLTGNLFFL